VLLLGVDERFREHDTGPGHPERPARLRAVEDGLSRTNAAHEAQSHVELRSATRAEVERVHTPEHLDALEATCRAGGGRIDADTVASRGSWDAALLAAGAGIAAVEALEAGQGDAAFLALRPPGHHAVPAHSMGFCLINNVAVTAAALAATGRRVLVVDWDAHHGNGTQDIFYESADVMYVSLHEWPLYPGTGRVSDTGRGPGAGTTVNVPLPAGATGDVYLEALDTVVAPLAERFAPDWVLVSSGYDAHRDDPITGLGLSSGDFVDLTERVAGLAPQSGRLIVFLEGGYDLDALRGGVEATCSVLEGRPVRPEPATSGGPGVTAVARARQEHRL
jgi:acetoin utilization deacetylase AcuC-like enzyme